MNKPRVFCFFAMFACARVLPVGAVPSYFNETGHWYEAVLVSNGVTWPEANAAAARRGGYLCTVTNAAENTFVASLVNVSYYSDASINNDILGPWLGAFRNANDPQWQWVTGEPFSFTAWYSGQPDGYGGSNQKLQYYARFSVGSTWGDHPGTPITGYSLPRGYIVEYNTCPVSMAWTNGIATISWPSTATNWVLETTSSLTSPSWTTNTPVHYQIDANGFFINVTNPVGTAFFRLRLNK